VAAVETQALAGQAIRIRARCVNGLTEAAVLMPHPMETGLRHGDGGATLPAHFITEVRVSVKGRTVLEARMSIAVSQDPLLRFRFRGAHAGDPITASWTDNLGQRRSDESLIG
jgi:sulfur-oxidizing protein SoxZ